MSCENEIEIDNINNIDNICFFIIFLILLKVIIYSDSKLYELFKLTFVNDLLIYELNFDKLLKFIFDIIY